MVKTPERLKKVQELFHAVLPLESAARTVFLVEACGSDRELIDEVQSLVSAHEQEGSFIDSPAAHPVAGMLASVRSESHVGQTVGSFKILSQLGRGGMGVVYLAQDSKLGRKVALKLLPEEFTRREDLVRRFALEAKAASGLNHPNIVTVYEIGQTGSSEYIATEYIEGETLRQHFARGRMSVRDVLDVVIQLAGALVAAHGAGIVHRDIKPENIMLRPDGYLKILDFGLAKTVSDKPHGARQQGADLEAATLVKMETEPGAMIGTIYYMAPEQARGLPVDARADIFSVGVIAYEMVAGRRPFGGDTNLDTLISTLEKEPPPLASCAPGAPAEIQRIISKALRKNREERYQSAKDLWVDLKNLREELAFEAKLERSGSPEASRTQSAAPEASDGLIFAQSQKAIATEEQAAQTTSFGAGRGLKVAFLFVVLIIACVIGVTVWLRARSPQTASVPADDGPVASERVLTYWAVVQTPDGKQFDLPGDMTMSFEKGYRIRLNFKSPQSGYLYILNEGPGATLPLNVLFPSPTANGGSSFISGNQQIYVPDQTWLHFDEEEGTEKIWLVWSAETIPNFDSLKTFINKTDKGAINFPGLNSEVKEFLKSHSTPRAVLKKDDEKKETEIRAASGVLVHAINLQHH